MPHPVCQTLNVDLYSGPGVGKSVLKAQIYVALKLQGIHAETVKEYAKELTYQGLLSSVTQKDIATEQLRRQTFLQGQVRVVITDSGVPLSLAYCTPQEREELTPFIKNGMGNWTRLNVLLHRDVMQSYERGGRNQTPEEARLVHEEQITPVLRQFYGDQLIELSTDDALPIILAKIAEHLSLKDLSESIAPVF